MKEKEIERILCSKSFATSLASGTAAAAKDARPLVSLHRVHRSPFLLLGMSFDLFFPLAFCRKEKKKGRKKNDF